MGDRNGTSVVRAALVVDVQFLKGFMAGTRVKLCGKSETEQVEQ